VGSQLGKVSRERLSAASANAVPSSLEADFWPGWIPEKASKQLRCKADLLGSTPAGAMKIHQFSN